MYSVAYSPRLLVPRRPSCLPSISQSPSSVSSLAPCHCGLWTGPRSVPSSAWNRNHSQLSPYPHPPNIPSASFAVNDYNFKQKELLPSAPAIQSASLHAIVRWLRPWSLNPLPQSPADRLRGSPWPCTFTLVTDSRPLHHLTPLPSSIIGGPHPPRPHYYQSTTTACLLHTRTPYTSFSTFLRHRASFLLLPLPSRPNLCFNTNRCLFFAQVRGAGSRDIHGNNSLVPLCRPEIPNPHLDPVNLSVIDPTFSSAACTAQPSSTLV